MQKSPSDPIRPGDLVHVRRRRWRVIDVRAYETCQVLSLAGAGADLGSRCRVITPFDRVDPIVRPAGVRLVSRRLWRRACRALIAEALPPGALRSAARARMDLLPHQLEPALAIASGAGCRLLLADAVGLGKTIQAALVLSELRARRAIDRALILTPAGLRDQWARELSNRVGIDADIADARDMRRRLAALPVGENPWSTIETAIASFDYVKRAEILPAVSAVAWDLVIVDEAHNVAGSSDRHGAVAALAGAATYVLLLTATPHNGDRRAFLSLCSLGDRGDPLLLFRRSRDAVRIGAGRRVHCLAVRPNGAERRMHALVARLTRAVRADHADTDVVAWLALTVLHKRALSSARSLAATVERRLTALVSGTPGAPDADAGMRQLTLPLPDPDGEENEADRPPDLAGLALADRDRERSLLRQLAEAARRAAIHETKIAALTRFLARVAEPVIVFTEYRDTLLHLHRAMKRPAAILHGGLTRDERAVALADFVSGRRSLLLATDAAGEGLNLHERCRIVVNLELPWNPMRLEQRIGRVDRIGQLRTVHALHLIARDTGESQILSRLRERVARAQADVGAGDPLGMRDDEREAARVVIGAFDPRDEDAAPLPPGTAPIEVPFEMEARAEVGRLADSRRWIRDGDGSIGFQMDCNRAWLMFARGRTRTALGDSLLLLFRTATEDARGRTLDSALVPVRVPWPRSLFPRVDAQAVRSAIDAVLPHAIETVGASASWTHASADLTRAFIAARLSRDRAIADAAASRSPTGVFQAGLFDHRADQAHRSARAAESDAAADRWRRIASAEESAGVVARAPQLLLVLAP